MNFDSMTLHSTRHGLAVLALAATLAACGGGEFAELFVKLISARFVPASVSLTAGATRDVDFEVSCDNAALDTPFGRLALRVKMDPEHRLGAGVTATLTGAGSVDAQGFRLYPCTTAVADPALRIAHVGVRIAVAEGTAPQASTLLGYVEIEPLVSGEPSKDSTTADLAITVTAGPVEPGGYLPLNPRSTR